MQVRRLIGGRSGPRAGSATLALTVAVTVGAAVAVTPVGVASAAPTPPTPAASGSAGQGWQLAATTAAAAAAAPAYVGNGYVGTRIPATGAGFVTTPIATETHVAGVYADVPDTTHGGTQRQGSVNLPGWTQLDLAVGGVPFAASAATNYRQLLDLRTGVVTTTATWTTAGKVTDVSYQVTLDRARQRVGLVRLQVTPHWSGTLQVADVLGAGATQTAGGLTPVTVTATADRAVVTVRTTGTNTTVAEVGRLTLPTGSTVRPAANPTTMVAARTATVPVTAGSIYQVTKVVGFATSLDAPDPTTAAAQAAVGAPTADAVLAETGAAWQQVWTADIVLPGQPQLQRRVRAAEFYLLASTRPDVDRSVSPVGLSAGGYNDHVFWDAETWMYPALLAQHPGEASSVVDYRFATMDGARRNASAGKYAGLRYAWESALTGDEVTPSWAETGRLEQHVTADVALAQWQYYLATGDLAWLKARGWPVIEGAAEFWASRAESGSGGSYHINQVEGPDEENWPVDDSAYLNGTAQQTLEIATKVAGLVGQPAPAQWGLVAKGMAIQQPTALGGQPAVRPEYRGYAGQQVKQADTVLLTYPWEYQQPAEVDRSNLNYYTPRYDPDGPAMTDSVNSIVAAQLGLGCSDWTYTQRSVDPFVKAPYEQFTEARSGQGVFTFLTGEGGFLQEFLYGYSGLRWRADRIHLDPSLPPPLAGGLQLIGLRWQGRVFDLAIGSSTSTLTLRSGSPMPVQTPAGDRTVSVGAPLQLPTRASGPGADDLARCRPVTANAADPSSPADAAVDGSPVTAWNPGTDPATDSTLTVTLAGTATVGKAIVVWQQYRPLAPYTIQVRTAGAWQTMATVSSTASLTDTVTFPPTPGDAVRVVIPATRFGGKDPALAELTVTR